MTGADIRTIQPDEADMRLDKWFKHHFPDITHGYLEKLLRTGQIRINGHRVKAKTHLEIGHRIRVPLFTEKPVVKGQKQHTTEHDRARLQSMVIHCDEEVLVLNKPSGIAVQGGSRIQDHLDGWLQALRCDMDERLRLVHRLDKDVSGLLVIARTGFAARKLGQAFRQGLVTKTYCAITQGVPYPEKGAIKTVLGKVGQKMGVTPEGGKWSETRYQTVDKVGKYAALIALRPLTGRKHQLRVHLAHIGNPILGDLKYGYIPSEIKSHVGSRLHLHASYLAFPHPRGGYLSVCAPLAEHMEQTCSWLELQYTAFEEQVFL